MKQTTILIVDDSETVRREVRRVLPAADYRLLEAADGAEGLRVLESEPEVSLVILDVNMPRMNGIEMLGRVREQGIEVPVIVLTTEGESSMIKQARAAGALAWMVKPFKADMLLKAVANLGAR